jgi:hypothetical protein
MVSLNTVSFYKFRLVCSIIIKCRSFGTIYPRRTHVGNSMRYLFASAGITDRGLHSLRHTTASAMVNGGASFKGLNVLPHG